MSAAVVVHISRLVESAASTATTPRKGRPERVDPSPFFVTLAGDDEEAAEAEAGSERGLVQPPGF